LFGNAGQEQRLSLMMNSFDLSHTYTKIRTGKDQNQGLLWRDLQVETQKFVEPFRTFNISAYRRIRRRASVDEEEEQKPPELKSYRQF